MQAAGRQPGLIAAAATSTQAGQEEVSHHQDRPSAICIFSPSLFCQCQHSPLYFFLERWGTEAGDQRGWMGADQIFFRNSNRQPIFQKSPKPSSVLAKVWNSYGKAKPTQKGLERASETSKQIGSESGKLQNWSARIGLTGVLDRSDRSRLFKN